ncbi:MAG: hypothetical protein LAT58_03385 [Opitutales bacterium]|nr:hypothetical protein [Opitutales bacterium]
MSDLFPELNPTKDWLNPPTGAEPVFWISEVRLLSRLSTDEDALIRTIPLRKGINIIWSEGSEVGGPPEQRGRGHGAGKTSFCRVVRYLLGEKHYGNRFIRDRMVDNETLSRAYVGAEIWIGDVRWGVIRALYQGGSHFAVPGADINGAIYADPSERFTHKQFIAELETAVLSRLEVKEFDAVKGQEIKWGHILQPLSRDQETHLSGLHTWRHLASASDSPGMEDSEKPFLIRCLLGLADTTEGRFLQQRAKAQTDISTAKNTIEVYRRVFNDSMSDLLELYPDLRTPVTHDDPLFIKDVTDKAKRKQQIAIQAVDKKVNSLGLTETETAIKAFGQERSRIEGRIEERQQQLATLQSQLKSYKAKDKPSAEDEKALQEAILASLRRKDSHCCVPIEFAMKECQFYWRHARGEVEQDNPAKTYKISASQQVEARIKKLSSELEPSIKEIGRLDRKEKTLAAKLIEDRKAERVFATERDDAISTSSDEIRLAQNILGSLEKIDAARLEIQKNTSVVTKCEKVLDETRARSKTQQTDASVVFDQMIKKMLNDDYSGKLSFTKIENSAYLYRHGELESEAYKALKALGYDLTVLLTSIWGIGHHPGFLMHDSPRESDLEPAIYQLFLRLVAELVEKVPGAFQYIVTTTEAPPVELRGSPPVQARLDSSNPDGFLFRIPI